MTTYPVFFKKWCAFNATILAWSGWATSEKIVSTMPGKKIENMINIEMKYTMKNTEYKIDRLS